MQKLDADVCLDIRIDELFKRFDASKDALIQFEEFCEWMGRTGVKGSSSLDVIIKSMGEVLLILVSEGILFARLGNNEHHFNTVTLKADGSYIEVNKEATK